MSTPYVTEGARLLAQRRLQGLADGLESDDLDAEIRLAAVLLAAELPELPDYLLLDAAHQAFYDVATGLRGAMTLLVPAILAANDGVAKLKTPEFEYTFTVPPPAERERWAAEIAQAVGYLEQLCRPPRRPRRTFSMFGAAGVAGARERQERRLWSEGEIVRLLVPDGWLYDTAFGALVQALVL